MKTWTDKKEKVFINVCRSEQVIVYTVMAVLLLLPGRTQAQLFDMYSSQECVVDCSVCVVLTSPGPTNQIPTPKDITDEQLDTLLESGDASQYRIPISLGEPHTITDNCEYTG